MQKKLNKIAQDTNLFLKKFVRRQKKSELIIPMKYGLFSGGKKIRSKILIDIGSIFKIDYKSLIILGAAVECIHAYSLIHDDLPCMDNDLVRRGKPSTHIKFGESTAVLAGNSLLTMAFEILSHKELELSEILLIKLVLVISGIFKSLWLKISKAIVKRELPAKTAVDSPNLICVEGLPLLTVSLSMHGKSSCINE